SGRPGVQPREPAGDDYQLRTRQHDHSADQVPIDDRVQAAPGPRSGSAGAVDRKSDAVARLPADDFARSGDLADDSVVRRAHGGAAQELMRVIVTGAAGFIGRNFLLRAPRDWEIFAVA